MKVSKQTISLLKKAKKVFPFLDKNLSSAHEEYMSGQIPHGAFNYLLDRHGNTMLALNCVDLRNGNIKKEAFNDNVNSIPEDLEDRIGNTISWMCHDLKSYVKIDLKSKKREATALTKKISDIETCLDSLGFTETNPILGIKTKPKK